MRKLTMSLLFGGALGATIAGAEMQHSMHADTMHKEQGIVVGETRELVLFPRPVYDSTLRNMREHLRGIHNVQRLVGEGRYAEAAEAAEVGMGMGHNHGADGVGAEHQFMPAKMMLLGRDMHMSAANLATVLREAEVTDELQPVFTALGEVTASCVACHDAYRLEPME